jgi:prepilin-type N-terminal cleavage/methylation domain-containing protein
MLNKKGFTLIECLISLAIMSFLMLGTMTWMTQTYNTNTENVLTEEGIKLVQELLETDRNKALTAFPGANGTEAHVNIPIMVKKQRRVYTYARTIRRPNNYIVLVSYNLTWNYNDKNYNYNAISAVGKKYDD